MQNIMRFILGPAILAGLLAATGSDSPWSLSVDPLLKLVESVGVLGVLVWYLWYITSRDRPRLEKRHQEMLEHTEASHSESIKSLMQDFRTEFQEQRASYRAGLEHIVGQMETQNKTVLEVVRTCAIDRARQPAQK